MTRDVTPKMSETPAFTDAKMKAWADAYFGYPDGTDPPRPASKAAVAAIDLAVRDAEWPTTRAMPISYRDGLNAPWPPATTDLWLNALRLTELGEGDGEESGDEEDESDGHDSGDEEESVDDDELGVDEGTEPGTWLVPLSFTEAARLAGVDPRAFTDARLQTWAKSNPEAARPLEVSTRPRPQPGVVETRQLVTASEVLLHVSFTRAEAATHRAANDAAHTARKAAHEASVRDLPYAFPPGTVVDSVASFEPRAHDEAARTTAPRTTPLLSCPASFTGVNAAHENQIVFTCGPATYTFVADEPRIECCEIFGVAIMPRDVFDADVLRVDADLTPFIGATLLDAISPAVDAGATTRMKRLRYRDGWDGDDNENFSPHTRETDEVVVRALCADGTVRSLLVLAWSVSPDCHRPHWLQLCEGAVGESVRA